MWVVECDGLQLFDADGPLLLLQLLLLSGHDLLRLLEDSQLLSADLPPRVTDVTPEAILRLHLHPLEVFSSPLPDHGDGMQLFLQLL